jgi:IS66 Orf2 like protein
VPSNAKTARSVHLPRKQRRLHQADCRSQRQSARDNQNSPNDKQNTCKRQSPATIIPPSAVADSILIDAPPIRIVALQLIKILWHDGVGMCLFIKRLERGQFVWPMSASGTVSLTPGQLSTLLEGCEWRALARNLRPKLAG